MNKSSPPPLKNINFDEDWTSHPAVEWLSAHKKTLLWAFFILIVLLILASRLLSLRNLNAESDFFQAQTDFNQLQEASSSETPTSPELEQLVTIMQKHPELKPKYEGALAQTLLIEGNVSQAKTFIADIFKRTQPDSLNLYQDYTQTSILIGEGQYMDALQQAKKLQSSLDLLKEEAPPLLSIFNLIRLGSLYQQTHQPQEELKIWEEFQYQPQRPEAILAVNQILQVGQASFDQYIAERKQALAKQEKR